MSSSWAKTSAFKPPTIIDFHYNPELTLRVFSLFESSHGHVVFREVSFKRRVLCHSLDCASEPRSLTDPRGMRDARVRAKIKE